MASYLPEVGSGADTAVVPSGDDRSVDEILGHGHRGEVGEYDQALEGLVAALRRHRLAIERRLLGPGRSARRQRLIERADQRFLVLPPGGRNRRAVERAAARLDRRESLEEAVAIALQHRLGEQQIDEAVDAHLGR